MEWSGQVHVTGEIVEGIGYVTSIHQLKPGHFFSGIRGTNCV